MARQDQINLASELAALQRELGGPRLTLVTTTIIPVEPNDVPGRQCPITGSERVRGLEVIDDLSFMVDHDTGDRTNRWTLGEDDLVEYDALASAAVRYDDPDADEHPFWHAPIVWQCPEDHVEDLLDDETQVIFESGGWRSGKTIRIDQWWQRGWCKYGRHGERFWLMGPEVINAWRMYQKLFVGSAEMPPLFPSLDLRQPSFLAIDPPDRRTRRDLEFRLIDGSIVELYHVKGKVSHVEGESVRRIAIDEAWAMPTSAGYDVALGRVMQCNGQVGLSSVPDEDCQWMYEKIVAEYERRGAHIPRKLSRPERERPIARSRAKPDHIKCRFISGYDNPWMPRDAVDRALAAQPDEVVADNKIRGLWTRRGLYAYSSVWDPATQCRDELSCEAPAWGLGPDITEEVIRREFGKKGCTWGGGVDFSGGGDKPQTRIWWKVFGDIERWETWNLVIMDEESTATDAKSASAESKRRAGGRYVGACMVGDPNGFHDSNREGGRATKTNDAQHYKLAGFQMVAPIATQQAGQMPKYSSPEVGESRTCLRDLMRRRVLWVNEGKCPGSANALAKAPNRRKRNADKNTWIEKQVYAFEDCFRYVAWKIFSKHQLRRDRSAQAEAEAAAKEGEAAA